MVASIHPNRFSGRTWKIEAASLTSGIEISHHDMKHLPGSSRIALGNRGLLAITVISIPPRDIRQPRTPAANQSRPLRDGQPYVE